MSAFRAITGATVEQFKALQDNALKLGATTAKSAIQVASLQKEFAKLGFSTTEIIAATEATINLSIAAESDLGEAAVVAASTIRGFGFAATEATRITDVMAKSFTTTGLNLDKFKTGMANAQVAAKSTGRSFEFTAAALGTIVDTGTDASKAGTDLRAIFSKLAISGISLEDAYDRVNKSSNKVATAQKLVGDRAFSSLITLSEQTDKVDDLTESYKNSGGAAKEMADIMADNLAGDIVLATSAWEGFILSLNKGEGTISKVFRKGTQAATSFLNTITKINQGETLLAQNIKYQIGFEDKLEKQNQKNLKVVTFLSKYKKITREEAAKLVLEELKNQEKIQSNLLKELELRKENAKGNANRARLGKEAVKGATAETGRA